MAYTKTLSVRIGEKDFRTEIISDDHTSIADEPTEQGGNNEGPDPYELLLGALGSCTAITLRMYANRKKWPLKGLEIILRHQKKHSEDCEHCEDDEKSWLDQIDLTLNLVGELSQEQIAKLLIIADKCPVHKTLTNSVSIKMHVASRSDC